MFNIFAESKMSSSSSLVCDNVASDPLAEKQQTFTATSSSKFPQVGRPDDKQQQQRQRKLYEISNASSSSSLDLHQYSNFAVYNDQYL